eukprot:m51a1_g11772 hypothetical protein (452) ;mRNA; f:252939-254392
MEKPQRLDDLLQSAYCDDDGSQLKKDMMKQHGVNVRQDECWGLFLLKYDIYRVNWGPGIAQQCRGVVFHHRAPGSDWLRLSRPFEKFFNSFEEGCTMDWAHFRSHPSEYRLVEKADGTCVELFFVPADRSASGEAFWCCSTLGECRAVPEERVGPFAVDFQSLIAKFSGETWPQWSSRLDVRLTYIFEMCGTKATRLQTVYEGPRIYLLATRQLDLSAGRSVELETATYNELLARCSNWLQQPVGIPCGQLDPSSLVDGEALRAEGTRLAHQLILRPGVTSVPEGWVLYRGADPVLKLKTDEYLASLKKPKELRGEDLVMACVGLVLDGKADDALQGDASELTRRTMASVSDYIASQVQKVLDVLSEWKSKHADVSPSKATIQVFFKFVSERCEQGSIAFFGMVLRKGKEICTSPQAPTDEDGVIALFKPLEKRYWIGAMQKQIKEANTDL